MSKNTRFTTGLAMDTASIPDLPNLSELVTGTYQHPMPTISGSGPMRSSRFASRQHAISVSSAHKQLDAVPLPEDEKQIFAMLKLLRGKVDVLEQEKAVAEKRAEDAEVQNELLRNGSGTRNGIRREHTRREDARREGVHREDTRSRQDHDRRVDTRQDYHSRGDFDITQESFVDTRFNLAAERADLELNLGSVQKKLEAARRQMANIELSVKNVSKERDSALAKTRVAHLTVEELKAENEALRRKRQAYEEQISKINKEQREQQRTSSQLRDPPRKKEAVVEADITDSEADFLSKPVNHTATRQGHEATDVHDETFLSAFDPSRLPQLRKSLEEERLKRKAASAPPIELQSSRKSALKKNPRVPQDIVNTPTHDDDDLTQNLIQELSRPLFKLNRRPSDPTITAQSNTSRRRAPLISEPESDHGEDEMTSGFFLPDVTISRPVHLSNAAQAVINAVSPHDKASCTFCKRISGESSDAVKIPTVIPPSLRASGPDVTARPAHPPHLSLAVVLKQLSDELIHLKGELASFQSQYQSFDPSMGRRARKALVKRIRELESECEAKSEQIYRLHDVVEEVNGGEGEGEGEGEAEVIVG